MSYRRFSWLSWNMSASTLAKHCFDGDNLPIFPRVLIAPFKATPLKIGTWNTAPFTMCHPLQKAVRLLLGLSAIYRERHLGRYVWQFHIVYPYVGIRLVVTLLTAGASIGLLIPNSSNIGNTHWCRCFVRQRRTATDPDSAHRLYHIWPDSPGYSTTLVV